MLTKRKLQTAALRRHSLHRTPRQNWDQSPVIFCNPNLDNLLFCPPKFPYSSSALFRRGCSHHCNARNLPVSTDVVLRWPLSAAYWKHAVPVFLGGGWPTAAINTKGPFGKNGTAPSGDRFCCENSVLSVPKWKEKGDLYEGTERNRCIQTGLYEFVCS